MTVSTALALAFFWTALTSGVLRAVTAEGRAGFAGVCQI